MNHKTIRLAACATTSLFLAGLFGGAATFAASTTASAAPESATVAYSCNVAGLTTTTFNFTVAATAPASVDPGGTITLSGVQLSTAIPAPIVTEIVKLVHLTSFSGAVTVLDFDATGATPGVVDGAGSGISFTIPFVLGQAAPLTIPSSPETLGPFTAAKSGTVVISPGEVVISTVILGKTYAITCTPPSSLPAGAALSISIAAPGSTTTTTTTPVASTSSVAGNTGGSSTTTTAPPATVPATHTGEPWSGWPYWAIVGFLGAMSFLCLEMAFQRRRRRGDATD